jgi:hypothetical protein
MGWPSASPPSGWEKGSSPCDRGAGGIPSLANPAQERRSAPGPTLDTSGAEIGAYRAILEGA